jgi:hypothetical protein
MIVPTRDNQTNRPTAVVCELPDCGHQRVVPAFAGTRLRWTPDSGRIAYIEPDGRINIWTMPVGGGRAIAADALRQSVHRRLRTGRQTENGLSLADVSKPTTSSS